MREGPPAARLNRVQSAQEARVLSWAAGVDSSSLARLQRLLDIGPGGPVAMSITDIEGQFAPRGKVPPLELPCNGGARTSAVQADGATREARCDCPGCWDIRVLCLRREAFAGIKCAGLPRGLQMSWTGRHRFSRSAG